MGKHSDFPVGKCLGFTIVMKLQKFFESLYGLGGGRCQELRDVSKDFEPCLKVYSLISGQHTYIKASNLLK